MRQCARQLAAESNDGETRLQLPALWLVGWDQHSPADPPQTSEFCTKTCPITHHHPPPPFRRFTTHRFCPSLPTVFFLLRGEGVGGTEFREAREGGWGLPWAQQQNRRANQISDCHGQTLVPGVGFSLCVSPWGMSVAGY